MLNPVFVLLNEGIEFAEKEIEDIDREINERPSTHDRTATCIA